MGERNFDNWMETMKDSIATWNYYTDFPKVYKNADEIKTELYILNSLVKSKDIQNDFKKLLNEYPQILKAIPILLAKREKNIIINDAVQKYYYNFEKKGALIPGYIANVAIINRDFSLGGLFINGELARGLLSKEFINVV